MKIVLCKGRFAGPISGSDETLVAYAVQLKSAGYDVEVAVLYPPGAGDPYAARLRDAAVPVSCIARSGLIGHALQHLRNRVPHLPSGPRNVLQKTAGHVPLLYVRRCEKHFRRSGADVVHVVTPDPAAMAMIRAAHAAHLPILYHELGTPDFLPELNVYYEMLAEVLPLCDEIAALSPTLARRFSEKFAPASVLPLMVEDVPIAESAASKSGPVTFGFASRLEYGKAPLLLLSAFADVSRRVEASLRMAGDGPQRPEIAAHAQELSLGAGCELVGTYSGPAQRDTFMRSIDVLVQPSLAEGTPNVIIEAMAYGLPVIASAVGGIPDTVSPEMAILVAPGDVRALAEAMTELATCATRRVAMGRAARQRYERMFSPAAVLPLLDEQYRRLVGKRSKASTAVCPPRQERRMRHARDVAARTGEARNQPAADGIGNAAKHTGDGLGRVVESARREQTEGNEDVSF